MTTSPARALPELPEPTMRESNPYLNAPFDPHHGREILHWFNGEQIRAYALTYGQQCAQAQGEAQAAEIARLREALAGLEEAYCRAGSPLTKAERHEDRLRLMAARAALKEQS